MERITLYHHGTPVTHHPLEGSSFSVGSHPSNDLILAWDGVAERHLVVYRAPDGRWRVRPGDGQGGSEAALEAGERIPLGPFAVGLDPAGAPRGRVGGRETGGGPSDAARLGLVGRSAQLKLLARQIARLGPLAAPVLVSGETGTGKELVARGLHRMSSRAAGPFVPVNCGGLAASLLEDTLFGHDRGSFTGAAGARRGVFEQAQGGTLFLDEIGELPLAQQSALLRVLDDRRVHRIGAERAEVVDFRLVAATNRDIKAQIRGGRFRLDLFHRIAALTVATTPLRDRPDDVAPLARHFLAELSADVGQRHLAPVALAELERHDWPGNVRELRNCLLRAAASTGRARLEARDFQLDPGGLAASRRPFRLDDVPDSALEDLLRGHGGNVAAAARELGVPRTSLRDRLLRGRGDEGYPCAS